MERYDDIMRFSALFAQSRYDAGKSREYMALELGVSPKTIQNWEKGISMPNMYQMLEWYKILGVNPMPDILKYLYPSELDIDGDSSDQEIEVAFDKLIEGLSVKDKRSIMYIFYGKHGSSPQALLQLFLAHMHLPIRDRVATASHILQLFKMANRTNSLICTENIMPDIEGLESAINAGVESVVTNKYGYVNKK